jgi:hypothetical protein
MAAYLPTLYIFEFTEGAAVVMSGAEGGAINLLKHVHGNLPNLRLMHSIPLVVQNSPFKARILSCRGLRSIVGLNETIQPQVEDFKRRPMNPPITSSVMQQNVPETTLTTSTKRMTQLEYDNLLQKKKSRIGALELQIREWCLSPRPRLQLDRVDSVYKAKRYIRTLRAELIAFEQTERDKKKD